MWTACYLDRWNAIVSYVYFNNVQNLLEKNLKQARYNLHWPPNAKNWLLWKDPDAGKDWRREEKGTTDDEMAGWHHRLDGHELESALGVGDGQGGLARCSPWGRKVTWLSNWTELNWTIYKRKSVSGLLITSFWLKSVFCCVINCPTHQTFKKDKHTHTHKINSGHTLSIAHYLTKECPWLLNDSKILQILKLDSYHKGQT